MPGAKSQPKVYDTWFLSLAVRNVRCFADEQTLDLRAANGRPARWTLILGDNGTGKTCLLQCLAALAPARWTQSISSTAGETSERADVLPRFVRRQATQAAFAAEVVLASTIDARPVARATCHDSVEGGAATGDAYGFVEDLADLSGGETRRSFGKAHPRGMNCIAYGPYRRWGRTRLAAPTQPSDETLFDPDAVLPSPEEWFLQRDYAASNPIATEETRRAAARFRDRVRDVLLRLLPGVTALEARVADARTGRSELWAETSDGWVPVADLGFGYQSTLAWVVDLAARLAVAYPDLDDPLTGAAVVLVDEIDLHLHPRWQRTLLTELAALFPNVQFVATAHSPVVVQAFPDPNVVVLRREAGGVRIDNAPVSVRHWRVDQILTSDLFGLEGARGDDADRLEARRDRLLAKPTRTPAEEAELSRLEEALDALPFGDTPEQREATALILRVAKSFAGSAPPRPPARKRARR